MQRAIETTSLFVLIVVASLRPLIGESYDSAGNPLTEALGSVADPSPLRTLVFDLLVLLATCGWLAARVIGPVRRYRRTGLEWGLVVIGVAAAVSCLFAGNKRLAINASVDWLCYPVLTLTLVQLMNKPWHRRLLLAAVIGSACAQAVQCFDQHFVGFENTWNHYQSIKAEFWARQGIDLDSAKVELFERRILANEASGFLPHSNIAGSYLVLCGLAAVGATVARWKRARDAISRLLAAGCTIATAAMLFAAVLTKSLGALAAGGIGLALWLVIRIGRAWIDAHRTKALVIGWGCVVVASSAVVGYGLVRDRLPHMSLTFRWQYWKASAGLIADHPLTGVGRENFSRHYLRYKPIDSPEEVANPHNLFVQAAADFGLLGLLGVIMAAGGASLAVTMPRTPEPRDSSEPRALPRADSRDSTEPRASARADSRDSSEPRPEARAVHRADDRRTITHGHPPSPAPGSTIFWAAAIIISLTMARLPLLDTNDPNFLYYASVSTGLAWLLGFMVFAPGGIRLRDRVAPAPPVVATGIAVALFAFALHETINFALFVPGSSTTFFSLLAVCIAQRCPVEVIERKQAIKRTSIALVAAAGVTAAVFILSVKPVATVFRSLSRAREAAMQVAAGPAALQLVDRHFREAIVADPLDPTPYVARAKWLFTVSSVSELRDEALELAVESLEAAIERDPFHANLRRLLMRVYQARANHTRNADDYLAAVSAAEEALKLYPLDPSGIVSLADCLFNAAVATGSGDALQEAMEQYEEALKLDSARPEWEQIRGFRDRQRDAIRARIQQIQQRVGLKNGP